MNAYFNTGTVISAHSYQRNKVGQGVLIPTDLLLSSYPV